MDGCSRRRAARSETRSCRSFTSCGVLARSWKRTPPGTVIAGERGAVVHGRAVPGPRAAVAAAVVDPDHRQAALARVESRERGDLRAASGDGAVTVTSAPPRVSSTRVTAPTTAEGQFAILRRVSPLMFVSARSGCGGEGLSLHAAAASGARRKVSQRCLRIPRQAAIGVPYERLRRGRASPRRRSIGGAGEGRGRARPTGPAARAVPREPGQRWRAWWRRSAGGPLRPPPPAAT